MQPTAVSRAVEDALKGGWRPEHDPHSINIAGDTHYHYIEIGDNTFLDKAFWVALGKVRGWTEYSTDREIIGNNWCDNWHLFIAALALDDSPEQFFLSLEGNEV